MEKQKKAKYFCENCGSEVPAKAKFCPKCGKFFSSVRCPECSKVWKIGHVVNYRTYAWLCNCFFKSYCISVGYRFCFEWFDKFDDGHGEIKGLRSELTFWHIDTTLSRIVYQIIVRLKSEACPIGQVKRLTPWSIAAAPQSEVKCSASYRAKHTSRPKGTSLAKQA